MVILLITLPNVIYVLTALGSIIAVFTLLATEVTNVINSKMQFIYVGERNVGMIYLFSNQLKNFDI